jgi:molybdenum cofactor synthesis domain-containing protein
MLWSILEFINYKILSPLQTKNKMSNNHIVVTAAILIIGNEILSGRTEDKNTNYIAKKLTQIGINLSEVRVISDNENEIITSVNQLRKKYNYLFTTGGIGSTHDDITAPSIAKALNLKLIKNQEAAKIISKYYHDSNKGEVMNMALMPEGSRLLDNPVTSAPGFMIENIIVMAGVPKIMQSMLQNSLPFLEKGDIKYSEEISFNIRESLISEILADFQNKYSDILIGSYPFKGGVSVVLRSYKKNYLATVSKELNNFITDQIKLPN